MWSRNHNYRYQRYSIGEKIKYYENILKKSNNTNIKAKKNLERFRNLVNGKKVFGNVFIVKDKEFDSNANDFKPRQVVCVEAKNGKAVVIPVRKNKNMVNLSNFDFKRSINVNSSKSIPFDRIYEKRGFKNTSNSFLTSKEKLDLHKKYFKT